MSREKFNKQINSLGLRFKQVRKAQSLTQQAFAKSLGIAQGFLSEVEQDKRMPGGDVFLSISRYLSINIHWLLTGEGEMHRQGERAPVEIKDIPVYNMKAWLDDYWKTATEDEKTWLKVHFRKCFPDFEQWLLKKERGDEDTPPEAHLKTG